MFAIYKRHNNKLYNKLVELSRNKFFYKEIGLDDDFETRILLIFFHLSSILKISKKDGNRKKTQEIFDNIFLNIEYHIRELGFGDVAVNKKMKDMNKIFYDILVKFEEQKDQANLLKKYFSSKIKKEDQNIQVLADYFLKFDNFCFDLDNDNMLNGSINFNYR
tara:strand:+ start:239 stop:727 length:489 start_codon:yes stop_codon:yes gene_type:complete